MKNPALESLVREKMIEKIIFIRILENERKLEVEKVGC